MEKKKTFLFYCMSVFLFIVCRIMFLKEECYMIESDWINRIQQNIRILKGYEHILKDEVMRMNTLTWYEKECLLQQLHYIHPLINTISQDIDTLKSHISNTDDIDTLKNHISNTNDIEVSIPYFKTKFSEHSIKKRKDIYSSYYDYIHAVRNINR